MDEVKSQPAPTGFQIHPENINKEPIDKDMRWREIFIERVKEKKEGKEKRVLMADAQIDKAVAGDTHAFNAIADRMEGKPNQGIDAKLTGDLNIHLVNYGHNNPLPVPASGISTATTESN